MRNDKKTVPRRATTKAVVSLLMYRYIPKRLLSRMEELEMLEKNTHPVCRESR